MPADMNCKSAIYNTSIILSEIYNDTNLLALLHPDKPLAIAYRQYPQRGAQKETYIWAELEVACATSDILAMRVVKMTVQNFF